MAKIVEEQKITLYPDDPENTFDSYQEVLIDSSKKWINIDHTGDELSMSLENWDNLVLLVEKAKKQINK